MKTESDEAFAIIKQQLDESAAVLKAFADHQENHLAINRAAKVICNAFKSGGKVIACGNGGSHCDAMHFAEELTGRYRENRPAYPAIAVSDPSHISCVGNDYGFEFVFSRFIQGLGCPGDVLFAISTSGNSLNVVRAVETAAAGDMSVVLLTGRDGGALAGRADVEIRVGHAGYADRIQEIHIKVIHILIALIERAMGAP